MPTIEFIIDEDGSVSIEAMGFKGKSCENATREIEKMLGRVTNRTRKKEYYLSESTKVKEKPPLQI